MNTVLEAQNANVKQRIQDGASFTILAIDPGNAKSAYALLRWTGMDDRSMEVLSYGKLDNDTFMAQVKETAQEEGALDTAIEMIASYGMAVGFEVFETCVFIGRLQEALAPYTVGGLFPRPYLVYRKDEKLDLCGNPRAKDANIRRALIERYARHDMQNGRGTKKNPDIFHGVSADCWAAIAVGVTFRDTMLGLYRPGRI